MQISEPPQEIMKPNTAFIGLGSNLSSPADQILRAYKNMQHIQNTRCLALSPLYKSKAVGPEQPDFINAAAKIETSLSAEALLNELQAIENKQQRKRELHWGPRTIDLDILLYADKVISSQRLTIPHPYIRERNFVLAPLQDISPEQHLPSGESIVDLLDICGLGDLRQLNKTEQPSIDSIDSLD